MSPRDPRSHRILSVTQEELNRIVLDVHDGPVQHLFAALSLLTGVEYEIEKKIPEGRDVLPKLKKVSQLIEASLGEIKSFLGTFRSPEFQRRSLEAVIESLVLQHEELTSQTVELSIHNLPEDVLLPIKIALYRIVQEALSNTYRHAGVERIWVKLWAEDGMICLQVFDYGRGFTPPPLDGPEATEREEHIGLRGMRDRVTLLDGTFELFSQPGKGTRITVKVPADV
ncbi:MAG: sensor histidine kinase [Chloroflexi bacterium]|nr:sensor histidine kinase [Chloroflexota bacterium]